MSCCHASLVYLHRANCNRRRSLDILIAQGVSMALRILEAIVPSHCADRLLEKLGSDEFPQVIDQWSYPTSLDRTCVRAVLDAETTESLTDSITALCGGEGFRVTLQPIEAIIPQPEETQPPPAQPDETEKAPLLGESVERNCWMISRDRRDSLPSSLSCPCSRRLLQLSV